MSSFPEVVRVDGRPPARELDRAAFVFFGVWVLTNEVP